MRGLILDSGLCNNLESALDQLTSFLEFEDSQDIKEAKIWHSLTSD